MKHVTLNIRCERSKFLSEYVLFSSDIMSLKNICFFILIELTVQFTFNIK